MHIAAKWQKRYPLPIVDIIQDSPKCTLNIRVSPFEQL